MTDTDWLKLFELQTEFMRAQNELLRMIHDIARVRWATAENNLTAIRKDVVELLGKVEIMEDQGVAIQNAIAELNQETDNLATRIMQIQQSIEEAPSVEEAKVAVSQLGQIAGRLRQLAAVPSNPVPGGSTAPDQPLPEVITPETIPVNG